jgi:hypothetical protein
MNRLNYTGSMMDPLAAIVFCHPGIVDYNYVHGKAIVKDGVLLTVDVPDLVKRHNASAARLARQD